MSDPTPHTSKKHAPDPSRSYGALRPEDETGMGRLDAEETRPSNEADRSHHAVDNRQDPTHQLNADDQAMRRQPDHSMKEEEPDGWDQAPTDIKNPEMKRHPRTEGRGGTP